jgi:hypothetical protein
LTPFATAAAPEGDSGGVGVGRGGEGGEDGGEGGEGGEGSEGGGGDVALASAEPRGPTCWHTFSGTLGCARLFCTPAPEIPESRSLARQRKRLANLANTVAREAFNHFLLATFEGRVRLSIMVSIRVRVRVRVRVRSSTSRVRVRVRSRARVRVRR